ncbi:MAG: hypothetical protein KDC00_05640, partial [Flavobacteriales bacterium]|nr:hypothetical protein [Flavobacteriales bacterium]
MLYLWHAVGMLWSTDLDFGLMDLGIKLPMLLVPLAVWWRQGSSPFSKERVLHWFVMACVAFTGFLILRGLALFGWEYALRLMGTPIEGAPYWNHLFSSYFSWYVHPTYLAYYLVFAIGAWTLTDLHD